MPWFHQFHPRAGRRWPQRLAGRPIEPRSDRFPNFGGKGPTFFDQTWPKGTVKVLFVSSSRLLLTSLWYSYIVWDKMHIWQTELQYIHTYVDISPA